jgi:cation transport ATPase
MLLDLTRAASFFLCIVTLYWVTISAFFVPGTSLQDRLTTALLRVALAACVSFLSGLLFSWPSRNYRQPHQAITSTLPVQLFFWALAGIAVLFLSSWYLATYPCSINISHDCNL